MLASEVSALERVEADSESDMLAEADEDTAGTAIAEDADGFRFRLLLSVSQHPNVPLDEQQKPPLGITEFWHSTTNLSSPNHFISSAGPKKTGHELVPVQKDGQMLALYVRSVQPPL